MKIYSLLIAAIVSLTSLAFINRTNVPETVEINKAYLAVVKKSIQKRYPANFKKSKVRVLSKKESNTWLQTNKKKNKYLQAANRNFINQILGFKDSKIYLFSDVKVQGCQISEILVAEVDNEGWEKFGFTNYIVTNDDLGECPMDPDPGEETEDVCTNIWGDNPGMSVMSQGGLNADAPPCVCTAESVTGNGCTDSGSCGTC